MNEQIKKMQVASTQAPVKASAAVALAKKDQEEQARQAQIAEAAGEAAETVAEKQVAESGETVEAARTIAVVAEEIDASAEALAGVLADAPMMFAQAGGAGGISTGAIVAGVALVGVGGSGSGGGGGNFAVPTPAPATTDTTPDTNKVSAIVFNVDEIKSSHDEHVFTAFLNMSAKNVVYGTLNRPTNIEGELSSDDVSLALIGIADVINWSFGRFLWVDEYDYDSIIKEGFLKGTAFTVSAGNAGKGGIESIDRDTGEISEPGFDKIPIYQSSPYDFTVGSIKTFDWNFNNLINDRAAKDAKFELADFSEVGPRFVDFYTYGDWGTSFAAPGVAGLITHILADNPDYDLNQIRTVLERNSKLMEFERDGNKWIAQVLDPYDLENNLIRDGRVGNAFNLFTDGITKEDYTFTLNTTHIIDTRTKVDGLYEIMLGRNPDQEGLDEYVNAIEFNNWSLQDVITTFANSEEAKENNWFNSPDAEATSQVALIERVQALYHVGLSREPTLQETVNVIDYYKNELDENWQQLVVDFVGLYNVDFSQQNWSYA